MRNHRHGKWTLNDNILDRVKELNEKAPANILITLVGNKIDLDSRQISREQAESTAKQHALNYHEVSAKENIGIEELFRQIAKTLPASSQEKKKVVLEKKPEQGIMSY